MVEDDYTNANAMQIESFKKKESKNTCQHQENIVAAAAV